MDATIKAAWVAALRSGEYTQGFDTLGSQVAGQPACHCVMGVLCELAVKADVGIVRELGFEFRSDNFCYDDVDIVLPESVQAWAGLVSRLPDVMCNDKPEDMAYLNDQSRLSFETFADLIEADLSL